MNDLTSILIVLGMGLIIFALATLGLQLGRFFNRPGAGGHCASGTGPKDSHGEPLSCGACSHDHDKAKCDSQKECDKITSLPVLDPDA